MRRRTGTLEASLRRLAGGGSIGGARLCASAFRFSAAASAAAAFAAAAASSSAAFRRDRCACTASTSRAMAPSQNSFRSVARLQRRMRRRSLDGGVLRCSTSAAARSRSWSPAATSSAGASGTVVVLGSWTAVTAVPSAMRLAAMRAPSRSASFVSSDATSAAVAQRRCVCSASAAARTSASYSCGVRSLSAVSCVAAERAARGAPRRRSLRESTGAAQAAQAAAAAVRGTAHKVAAHRGV